MDATDSRADLDTLARCPVLDRAGVARPLGDFWRDGVTVVVFLRHFGCSGCAENVTLLSPRLHELHALGVRTVLVGNGEPRYLDGFIERHGLGDKKVELVTDPTLAAFTAAGLVRSTWATFGPRALAQQLRLALAGYAFHGVQGDANQQGGALVVDGGRIVFAHANAAFADHAAASDLVSVALALAAQRDPVLAT